MNNKAIANIDSIELQYTGRMVHRNTFVSMPAEDALNLMLLARHAIELAPYIMGKATNGENLKAIHAYQDTVNQLPTKLAVREPNDE